MHSKLHNLRMVYPVLLLVACTAGNNPFPSDPKLRIHDIQGCSHSSPFIGQEVNGITGIVTKKEGQGFFIQDDQPDEKDCSSEAIYIYTGNYQKVLPGDFVSIDGTVNEFFSGIPDDHNLSRTEIKLKDIKIISRNHALPDYVTIPEDRNQMPDRIIDDDQNQIFDPDQDGLDFYESLESMLVRVSAGRVVGPGNPYNEFVLLPESFISNNIVSSEGALLMQEDDFNPERIILRLNPQIEEKIPLGARLIEPVTGVFDYSYGNFKISVNGTIKIEPVTLDSIPLEKPKDGMTLVSLNVQNLSRFDDKSRFNRLAGMLVKDLDCPDIVVLHEVMDDSGLADDGNASSQLTVDKLVESIGKIGKIPYRSIYISPQDNQDGGIEGGNIRSVILYRMDSEIQISSQIIDELAPNNPFRIGEEETIFFGARKPLLVLMEFEGHPFLLVAVHLTSHAADSPLFGNQQPVLKPEELQRVEQAKYINHYLESWQMENPDIPIILVGDLNDYPWSETLQAIKGNILIDGSEMIPPNERYSYILDGNAFQLDYVLASRIFAANVKVILPHINSSLDHSKQFSDHDPVYAEVGFP